MPNGQLHHAAERAGDEALPGARVGGFVRSVMLLLRAHWIEGCGGTLYIVVFGGF